MAPKSTLAQLKLLVGQLERDQVGPGPRAPRGGRPSPTAQGQGWDCAFCTHGLNNFADRTACYRCQRDRTTGVVQVLGAARQQGAPRQGQLRLRSRPAKPPAVVSPPPKEVDAEATAPPEDDPIGLELATARSFLDWVRKQKPPIRDKELPAAQKRLAEAESKDKARKPPGERLQSALSRVDHRQRQADLAREAADAAEAAAQKAREESDNAAAQLKEAQRELEVAQAVHRAWGPTQATPSQPYSPPGAFAGTAGLTPQQLEVLQQISAGFQPGSPQCDLLQGLLRAAPSPPEPPSAANGKRGVAAEEPADRPGAKGGHAKASASKQAKVEAASKKESARPASRSRSRETARGHDDVAEDAGAMET